MCYLFIYYNLYGGTWNYVLEQVCSNNVWLEPGTYVYACLLQWIVYDLRLLMSILWILWMMASAKYVDDRLDVCVMLLWAFFVTLCFCELWWKISVSSLNMHAMLIMNERTTCDAIQSSENVSNYHTKQNKTCVTWYIELYMMVLRRHKDSSKLVLDSSKLVFPRTISDDHK